MAKDKRLNRAKTQLAEYFTGERSPAEEFAAHQGEQRIARDDAVPLRAEGYDAHAAGWSKHMQSIPGL